MLVGCVALLRAALFVAFLVRPLAVSPTSVSLRLISLRMRLGAEVYHGACPWTSASRLAGASGSEFGRAVAMRMARPQVAVEVRPSA